MEASYTRSNFGVIFGREYYRGKHLCTVDLLFDWFGSGCFANKTKKILLTQVVDLIKTLRS
jgi:hypothetical protein